MEQRVKNWIHKFMIEEPFMCCATMAGFFVMWKLFECATVITTFLIMLNGFTRFNLQLGGGMVLAALVVGYSADMYLYSISDRSSGNQSPEEDPYIVMEERSE